MLFSYQHLLFLILILYLQSTSSNRQSFINLSQLGLEFIPTNENLLLLLDINADSIIICSTICFSNIYCRTFNFNMQSKRCRLYEGDIDNTGSIINSHSIQSVVGTIKLTADNFIDYGHPCSFCENKPYLICMNSICQCQSHSFYNGSICQSQKFIGGSCTNDIECRNDINLTCLSTMQCGFNLPSDNAYANLTGATMLPPMTHINSTISIPPDTTKISTTSNSDTMGLTSTSATSISATTIITTIPTTMPTITTTITSNTINDITTILTTSDTTTKSSISIITSGIGDTSTATSNIDSAVTTSMSTNILSPTTSGANSISPITTNTEGTSTRTSSTVSASTTTSSTDSTTTTTSTTDSTTTTTTSTDSTTTTTTSADSTSTTTTSTTTSTSTSTSTSTATSTSTTTATTTSTTTTTTTTTSTTTTTTTINPCTLNTYRWNTTGITILNASQVIYTAGIFFDSSATMYVVDANNQVVWKLLKNATTAIVVAGQLATSGSSASLLNSPVDVYIDSNNNMYVSDYNNARIQKFVNGSTIGATFAGISGSSGSALNQLYQPGCFSVDSSQTYMYISDYGNNRVMRYPMTSTTGTNGTIVAGGAGAGNTNTQLNLPWGIYYQPTI
ncbi:unnamed protein product, partial [Adineta steineri]